MPRAGETIEEWTIEQGCYETKSVDLKKPKRAQTPYMIWRSENYKKIKKNLGDQANTHTIANECRKQWKQIDSSIKSQYDSKAYDDHIRHSLEQWTYATKTDYISPAPAPAVEVDEEEDEEIEVEEYEIDGKLFYKTADGLLYDPETSECVGQHIN